MNVAQHYAGLICFSLQKRNVLKGTLITSILNSNLFPLFVDGTSKSGRVETSYREFRQLNCNERKVWMCPLNLILCH